MRHRVSGRKLGRNGSHRKAMFRNMACSLIKSLRSDEGDVGKPKVPGRIVTTVPKAKELRPIVEKLITMAKKAAKLSAAADPFRTDAERNSEAWSKWRESEQGKQWVNANAPVLALRRRAFSELRDEVAVDILFNELAQRFADRDGGYTRVVRLAAVRLGDSGQRAIFEFVGVRDRVKKSRRRSAPAVESAAVESASA
ncbi:MAG: 50S ribosomal protein L17 [Planctomycetaceae bacterium]|nr:50S ribosomal protein L17 [Planctomycetaceae bacterium]